MLGASRLLAELHVRLLLGLAELLEKRGARGESADRLREVLHHDSTREDVHRRLMRLYAQMGARDQAVRQFHSCQGVLRRELDLVPEKETLALYRDVLAGQIPKRSPTPGRDHETDRRQRQPIFERTTTQPFAGRDAALELLRGQLTRAGEQAGSMILVSGEAGVGKTRLVAEFATEAERDGAAVLWGGTGAHANQLAFGPFALALEGYAASRSRAERDELARHYPPLAAFVPSLGIGNQPPPPVDRPGEAAHLSLLPAIVRLLSDLARTQPVVVVLGDLHDADPSTLGLLQYLAHLAPQRRWLMIGTFRDEEVEGGRRLQQMIDATTREQLWLQVDLQRLARPDCDQLVRATLRGGCVGDGLLEHVYLRSLGNPLFAEELLGEMRERGELILRRGQWHESSSRSARVPTRVRSRLAMRTATMQENVRRVLGLAAAADASEISLAELRSGAAALEPPISDAALLDALDHALQSRILEERRDAYAFRHPLVRSATYEDLSTHRRDQLHAALACSRAETPHHLHLAAAGRCP